jgi:hypothetical protein
MRIKKEDLTLMSKTKMICKLKVCFTKFKTFLTRIKMTCLYLTKKLWSNEAHLFKITKISSQAAQIKIKVISIINGSNVASQIPSKSQISQMESRNFTIKIKMLFWTTISTFNLHWTTMKSMILKKPHNNNRISRPKMASMIRSLTSMNVNYSARNKTLNLSSWHKIDINLSIWNLTTINFLRIKQKSSLKNGSVSHALLEMSQKLMIALFALH